MRFNSPTRVLIPILLLASSALAGDEAPSPDVTKPPAREEFLILPLHVHILTAKDHPDIDCKLTDADIDRIIGKANGIWSKAGIVFRIETLAREEAENLDEFDAHKELADRGALGIYRTLAPKATRGLPGLHVYYIHHFAVNGVYLGGNVCFVQETAGLRKVEGGLDEPIPRVTSHEIGHALGLVHRQNTFNLLASGTTGTTLNEEEAARSRSMAKKINGMMTVAECEAAESAAEKKGDKQAADRLKTALERIPPAN